MSPFFYFIIFVNIVDIYLIQIIFNMSRIEELVFEAISLGITDNLYKRVTVLSSRQEYKHVELHKVYEIALQQEKEVLFKNDFIDESRNV